MTWWSTSCRRLIEAKKSVVADDQNGGVKVTHWFWGAATRLQSAVDKKQLADGTQGDKSQDANLAKTNVIAEQGESAEDKLNDLVLQNPQASGAALVNAMKANGLTVVKVTEAFKKLFKEKGGAGDAQIAVGDPEQSPYRLQLFGKGLKFKKKTKEADSSSNFPQVMPKESAFHFQSLNLRESLSDDGVGPTKFRVVLLQEGLGNFGDAFYYHRDALDSAVPVFTGSKIYADHPTKIDEEIRPERSVRDVLGHFENLSVEEDKSGRAQLMGDLSILPDKPFEWARALMLHSIEHAKKFPDKNFIGLSINASGDADPASIDDVIKEAPESARPKLIEAKQNGIESVKVVRLIKSAVSCDLVTEAGAGGKIINYLERK